MTTLYDVAAIGNAIVDVIAPASDDFLAEEGLAKGGMMLIDAERAASLYSRMAAGIEASGGSAGNTVAEVRAIFDPVFGRVFVPDYYMQSEVLFACLAVFLIQFECWGDVLWWYPSRYAAGKDLFPSWLPNFTQRIVPHELDVQPLY